MAEGKASTSTTITLRSRSAYPLKFSVSAGDLADVITFSPSVGHLPPNGSKEVTLTFSATVPVNLTSAPVLCELKRIEYAENPENVAGESFNTEDPGAIEKLSQMAEAQAAERALWCVWDDSMTRLHSNSTIHSTNPVLTQH